MRMRIYIHLLSEPGGYEMQNFLPYLTNLSHVCRLPVFIQLRVQHSGAEIRKLSAASVRVSADNCIAG